MPPPIPDPSEFPDWAYEARDFFRFEILHESAKSGARVGRIHTPHGIVDTPGYVAVATNAALKGVDFTKLSFGIVFIEADSHNKRKNIAVRTLMEGNGYTYLGFVRNSDWFINGKFYSIYDELIH